MNLEAVLKDFTSILKQAGIGTARLDCLILLEDITQKDRSWLLAHPEFKIETNDIDQLAAKVARRALHEPLAYIRNKIDFYGRNFYVDTHVLVPRPESETMIDLLKQHTPASTQAQIIDVGTGSGALAITAKLELPQASVVAIDIDPGCLEVAEKNAHEHQVDISFLQGNLLYSPEGDGRDEIHAALADDLPSAKYDTSLLCNLPYVPDTHQINDAALREPHHAIFGGHDGLDLYRRLFMQLSSLRVPPQKVFTESLPFQHEQLATIADTHGYELQLTDDFIQLFIR